MSAIPIGHRLQPSFRSGARITPPTGPSIDCILIRINYRNSRSIKQAQFETKKEGHSASQVHVLERRHRMPATRMQLQEGVYATIAERDHFFDDLRVVVIYELPAGYTIRPAHYTLANEFSS